MFPELEIPLTPTECSLDLVEAYALDGDLVPVSRCFASRLEVSCLATDMSSIALYPDPLPSPVP